MSELRQRSGKSEVKPNSEAMESKKDETPKASESKLSKFMVRSVVGVLMIGGAVSIIISEWATELLCILVGVIQVMTFREVTNVRYKEAKERNIPGFRSINWYFLFVTFFFLYAKHVLQFFQKYIPPIVFNVLYHYHIGVSYALYLIAFVGFIVSLKKGMYKYQFTQFAWTIMTLFLVIAQSHYMFYNIFEGLFWFVFPVSLIVCNDTMAYYTGFFFGRKFIQRKFNPLSPNKTWEGFIGGFLFTIVFAWFACQHLIQYEWMICPQYELNHCVPNKVFLTREYELPESFAALYGKETITFAPIQVHGIIIACFASFIAPFGGFFASGMKRAFGKKDFDSLFPGHGGMMDRMDCQLIMALFVFVYYKTFIIRARMGVDSVTNAISELPLKQQWEVFHYLNRTLSGYQITCNKTTS